MNFETFGADEFIGCFFWFFILVYFLFFIFEFIGFFRDCFYEKEPEKILTYNYHYKDKRAKRLTNRAMARYKRKNY